MLDFCTTILVYLENRIGIAIDKLRPGWVNSTDELDCSTLVPKIEKRKIYN
jgi:hypothetical protein